MIGFFQQRYIQHRFATSSLLMNYLSQILQCTNSSLMKSCPSAIWVKVHKKRQKFWPRQARVRLHGKQNWPALANLASRVTQPPQWGQSRYWRRCGWREQESAENPLCTFQNIFFQMALWNYFRWQEKASCLFLRLLIISEVSRAIVVLRYTCKSNNSVNISIIQAFTFATDKFATFPHSVYHPQVSPMSSCLFCKPKYGYY